MNTSTHNLFTDVTYVTASATMYGPPAIAPHMVAPRVVPLVNPIPIWVGDRYMLAMHAVIGMRGELVAIVNGDIDTELSCQPADFQEPEKPRKPAKRVKKSKPKKKAKKGRK